MAVTIASQPRAGPTELVAIVVAAVDQILCSVLPPAMIASGDWPLDVQLRVLRPFGVWKLNEKQI